MEIRCNHYSNKYNRTCNKLLFKVEGNYINIKCSCGKIVSVDIQELLNQQKSKKII